MQTILLIGVIAECALLLGFAVFKKCTRKTFWIVSAVTAVCCLVVAIAANTSAKDQDRTRRSIKGHIYMATQLLDQYQPENALHEISQVTQKEGKKYGITGLRGLAYNQMADYSSGCYLLKGTAEEDLALLYSLCADSQPADAELTQKIIENALDALSLSKQDIARYDAEMAVRYGNFLPSQQESDDPVLQIKAAIMENRHEEAYRLATENAAEGTIVDSIILSEMFVMDYGPRILSQEDEAYDALFQEATAAQIQLNRVAAESGTAGKDYQLAYAQYQIILQDLSEESARRACNYLDACYVKNTVYDLAYHLQMSRLLFSAGEMEKAVSHLDSIFRSREPDPRQWLALDILLLKEAYLDGTESMANADFYFQYNHLMKNLYQGVFDYTDYEYYIFFCSYLKDLFRGIYISRPDVSRFPEIQLSVSTASELTLTGESILLTDTDESIQNFQVTEEQNSDISLCFVLDRSGSMQGSYMNSAKQAIKDFVINMDSDIASALVTFESNARLDSPLANSPYLIISQVGKIQPTGGTNISSGLLLGAQQLSENAGKKIIILLSDGVDGNSQSMPSTLSQLQYDDIVVFSIGLPGCDEAYLANIAEETGGVYFPAADASALNAIYEELRNFLKNTYTITYQVTAPEETERKVCIEVVDSFVQSRRKYSSIITGEQYSQIYDPQLSDFFKQIGSSLGGY